MKYIKFIVFTILLSLVLFEVVVLGIICFPKDVYHSSYQSVIQDKFRLLKETNEPKIIIVAGSSSAYGLEQNMLEEATGYKVVNLGLHAGFGHLITSELSKVNINPGDIVLLGYEYGWQYEDGFDSLRPDLIYSGFDSHLEMYKYIPIRKWDDMLSYLFKHADNKNHFLPAEGMYSRNAFDSENFQYVIERNEALNYNREVQGEEKMEGFSQISDFSIKYLKEYKRYVESRGAEVFFIAPPLLADAVVGDSGELEALKNNEEKQIGIKYISNPMNYLFSADMMFDTIYHCNSAGEIYRTKLLIDELMNADIGDKS